MPFFNLQYISVFLAIIILFLADSHGVPFMDSQRKNTMQSRNFLQFGSLILDTVGNPLGYNSYGCWCGKGHRGELVVDATDHCCQVHDNCWQSLEDTITSCSPFTKWYDYKTTLNKDIQCTDPVGTCAYGTCLCDKAAVNCFARYRNTSYDPDFDNWEGICTETSKAPNVDPERCPPMWDKREKYSAGSVVSVNGIAYQSLYSVAPGMNPTANTHTSMFAGIIATWKKLKPCRRTNEADNF